LADNQTRLTIELETVLRNLNATLKGLDQIKRKLEAVAAIKPSQRTSTAAVDRQAVAAQRLAQQQQAAAIRAQQLANAQTRADQTTQRLALAQQRLEAATAATSARLGQQADAHVKAFRAIEAASKKTTQTVLNVGNALRSVGQGLASLGATLSVGLTAPLVAIGTASIDAAVRLDSLRRGLGAIVGGADEAARQLRRLTEIAKLPGIGFEEAIQGSIRLQAVGFSAKEAERSLREFSNAIALTGGGREELARITVQLGQLAAKGKVLSQDLRPIIEAAPAVGRALLQAFGTVNADDIQELGLSSKEFLGVLVDELSRLPRAAAGAKNSFENFRDEVFRAAAAVGEALLPGLIRLVEVVGPIVTSLANGFASLSTPLQLIVVGIAGLAAAVGPVLFVIGQLTLGIGRLLVGFVELNAAGILPSIAGLRAYATSALSAAAASRVLASTTALVTAGVGAGLAVIGAAVAAYAIYNAFQKDAVTLSKERAQQLSTEVDGLQQQLKFLNGLEPGVARTADEQQRLSDIYDKLNTQAQIRVAGISDEEKRLAALRTELQKLIQVRSDEQVQQAASVAAQIAASAAQITANENSRQSLTQRIAANNALVETLEREGRITLETGQQLQRLGITAGGDVRQAINALQVESANLVRRQKELGDNTEETQKQLEGYLEALRALDPQHRLTARQLLTLAQNMGLFRGDIQQMVPVLEAYIKKTDEAAKSTDNFNRSLSENERRLNEAGKRADDAAKARSTLIQSAAAVARETSVNFQGALKSLRQMVDAVPELAAAFKRESELTGKSLDELLRNALESAFKGRSKDKSGTSLRNAQEQLAKALAEVALASSEQQVAIEKNKNDQLLQAAETAQKIQLISYREFLEARAALTAASIDREITQQADVVQAAKLAQIRLLQAAAKPGISPAERTKRQAQAAEANETAIKAETKLTELQSRRQLITDGLNQSIREAQHEQLKDIRQLEIQYAELTTRIEESLNTATDEKFRESLTDLALAQDHLNKQIREATRLKDADKLAELELARAQNQRQIEVIQNIITQERATNRLAAAQDVIEKAKQRQSDLEGQIANDVELRGLTEEEAIRRRLAGENELRAVLIQQRDAVEAVALALFDAGRTVPKALTEFISQTDIVIDRLGKLTFSEQFRLAQKEFDRLNDERIAKIADVERAVRNRDIAEVEGAIIIRRINGQYTADLEAQLALLRQIADASNDRDLQRQAADAGEVVKDTKDQIASLSKQIESAGKDALRSGFRDFFNDLANRTATAKEALLNLLNSITTAINDVIAESLSKKLFESLFGGPNDKPGEGLIAAAKRLFGFGGDQGKGAAVVDAGKAAVDSTAVALEAAGTASATALTTGATAAGAALTTGGTTAGATLTAAITAAAASFSATVIAAGAAFAAAVGVGGGAQAAAGGLGSLFGGAAAAATGLFPAVPGGVVRIVEGGYPEAVLTTDPRQAQRQVAILKMFLRETKGLGGRIRGLASGGFALPDLALNVPRVPLPSAGFGDVPISSQREISFRNINLFDKRELVRGYMRSAEGAQDFLNIVSENAPDIGRRLGVR